LHLFEPLAPRERVFLESATPPPTVAARCTSGTCSPPHADAIARSVGWLGRAVFYPMGGTTTACRPSRRVQTTIGVRCDASVAYDPDFKPRQSRG